MPRRQLGRGRDGKVGSDYDCDDDDDNDKNSERTEEVSESEDDEVDLSGPEAVFSAYSDGDD
jgi:hypothetical protein